MKPHARETNLVVKPIENELLIYDLEIDKAYCLNESSAAIWHNSNGKRSPAEIASLIGTQLGESVTEDLVHLGLRMLMSRNLLRNSETNDSSHSPTRRKMLTNIGLASAAALPIVSSIVAPKAMNAQSLACPASPCRCPNASSSCNGSTSGPFVNCFSVSGGIGNCDCNGPFDVPDSGGAGFKVSLSGCSLS